MKDLTNGVLEEELKKAEQENNPTLLDCINRIRKVDENIDAETTMMKDFAPRSFYWERMKENSCIGNGGIIFHGPHDGNGSGRPPTFSVSLSSNTRPRWEIHT